MKSGIVAGSILVTKLTLMQTKWWVILRLYWCGSETYEPLYAIKNIQQANRAGWPAEKRSNRAKQTKEKQGQEEHFWKQGLLTKSHWSKSLKIHVKRLRWKHLPGKSNAPLLLYWVRSTVQSHETNIKGVHNLHELKLHLFGSIRGSLRNLLLKFERHFLCQVKIPRKPV